MDMEENIQKPKRWGLNIIRENTTMASYNKKEKLHLETNMAGVVSGASFLQVWDRLQFPRNEAPNNATLKPIVFAIKKPDKCRDLLQQHRRNASHTT